MIHAETAMRQGFTTPGPQYEPEPPPVRIADAVLPPMDHHEKMRMRAAAFRATRLYPGAVGELLSRELLSWEEFGYRLGGGRLVMRLVDDIMKATLERAQ